MNFQNQIGHSLIHPIFFAVFSFIKVFSASQIFIIFTDLGSILEDVAIFWGHAIYLLLR